MLTFRYLSSSIVTIFTLSPLSSTLPSQKPKLKILDPRKEISHNIWCSPDLPTPDRWPSNAPAPRHTYASLDQLCGFDRSRPNVGCLCDSPYVRVECRRELADPLLYAAFLPDCAHDCYCMHARIHQLDTSVSAVETGGAWLVEPWMGRLPGQPVRAAQRATARAVAGLILIEK